MKKMVGYVVAIAGLALMALGFNIINFKLSLFEGISSNIIAGAGIFLVVVGAFLSIKGTGGRRIQQNKEEVPIYEGTGKDRRIVGYRKN